MPPREPGIFRTFFYKYLFESGKIFRQVVCGKPYCNLPALNDYSGPPLHRKEQRRHVLILSWILFNFFFMPREDIERMIQESGVHIKLDMEEVRELPYKK
jgi:hypothetical protein